METEAHLFFDCTVASKIWRQLKNLMGYATGTAVSLEEELHWLPSLRLVYKIQNDGIKLVFNAYVYWLWRMRNSRIFEGKTGSVERVVHMVMSDVKIRLAANRYAMPEGPDLNNMEERWGVNIQVKHRRVTHTRWERPPGWHC